MSIGIKTPVIRFRTLLFLESHGIGLLSFRSHSVRRPRTPVSEITLMISVRRARMTIEACFQYPALALTLRILAHSAGVPSLSQSPFNFLDQV